MKKPSQSNLEITAGKLPSFWGSHLLSVLFQQKSFNTIRSREVSLTLSTCQHWKLFTKEFEHYTRQLSTLSTVNCQNCSQRSLNKRVWTKEFEQKSLNTIRREVSLTLRFLAEAYATTRTTHKGRHASTFNTYLIQIYLI